MPRFWVTVEVIEREVFDFDDIEASNAELAEEAAMGRAEISSMLNPDEINIIDSEELPTEESE